MEDLGIDLTGLRTRDEWIDERDDWISDRADDYGREEGYGPGSYFADAMAKDD